MIVLDTHVLVWWLAGTRDLSRAAKDAIKRAARSHGVVASAISVLEITTAVRRGRLRLTLPMDQWLDAARALPELRFEPVTDAIAYRAGDLGESWHGDPADRLIAATAMALGCPLVTADTKLREQEALPVIW